MGCIIGVSTSTKSCDSRYRRSDCHQLAALQEDLADFGIHHQVDVALAVAQFDVGQAVPLFRQRQQVFRQEREFFGVHAEFAGAGAEKISADADVVAQVEQFPEFESRLADRVFLDVDLETLAAALQVRETGFAHQADGHDASGNAHVDARGFEFFGRLAAVVGEDLRDGMREIVLARIGRLPESLDLLQLLAPDSIDVFVECQ